MECSGEDVDSGEGYAWAGAGTVYIGILYFLLSFAL